MQDDISRKLESKLDEKLFSQSRKKQLKDGFKKGKVVNEVLDKRTVMTLYKLITDHIIAYVNGSISAGKESVVFWAVDENNLDVALKIYLVSTSNFKKREQYILGDPRFSKLKKGTKNMVYLRHPNAQEFLKRDINNITRFFSKRGITVKDPAKVFEEIIR